MRKRQAKKICNRKKELYCEGVSLRKHYKVWTMIRASWIMLPIVLQRIENSTAWDGV